MPNFNSNTAISNSSIKTGIKGRLNFSASKPPLLLRTGTVVNFRNFGGDKIIGNTSTVINQPIPTRTVGQLFP